MEQGELEGLSRTAILTIHPTALTARAAVRDAVRRTGATYGARDTTFPELADTLARDLGVSGRVLPPSLAALVLDAAVGDLPDVSDAVRARGRGLLRELQASIDELKAARIAPAAVLEAADALPAEAAGRVTELGRIYRAYEQRLARLRALDRHGREWAVADRLADCARRGECPRALAGVRRVVFAEIYDVSVLQYLIATALIRLVGDAELVAFAHPENVDATRFLDRTWNRFVATESIADRVLPSFVVREGRRGSLAVALEGVFTSPPAAPRAGDGTIRLLGAPHRYGEVEAVLRDVRRRLEAGADPERLALVARDMGGRYANLVADVARRFCVPVYFRRGEALLASGAVREAIGVVRAALEGLPYARLAAILDGDYFGVCRPHAAALLARVGYVSAAVCGMEDCLARHAAPEAHDRPARAESARRDVARHRDVLARVAGAIAGLAGRRSVARHVRAWRRALRTLGFDPVAREDLEPVAAARDARAWERFDELLSALAGVAGGLEVGAIELDAFLGLVLATAELEEVTEAPASGGVRALSILDARGLDFDVVYVLGLDDGTFPAAHRESAILPDAVKRLLGPAAAAVVRRELAARGDELPPGPLLRTAREASLEDPFLFFLALAMPERELVLVHPATDERGNPTVRSPFVDDVQACFDAPLPEERVDPLATVAAVADCCAAGELVARAAADRWSGTVGPDRLTPALRARLPSGEIRLAEVDRRARVEAARSRYFLTPLDDPARALGADPYVGRVPAGSALAARVDRIVWSATSVEELAACGFKFFAARLLGARNRDEPGADLHGRDRGTLVHRLLELVLAECPVLPAEPGAARAAVRAAAERLRPAIMARIAPRERALVDVEWARVLDALDGVASIEAGEQRDAAAAGETIERHFEWRFSLSLPGRGGVPMAIGGTADRLDVWRRAGRAARLRVIDYKTGRDAREQARKLAPPPPGTPRIAYQVPLYVLAAVHAGLAGEGTELEGGYWSPLAPPSQQRKIAPVGRDIIGALGDELAALVATARGGGFDVAPRRCDVWCAYRAVCRYQPPPVEDEHV